MSSLSSNESIYDLLNAAEEIDDDLFASFSIPYPNSRQHVPGNLIHKQLNDSQNIMRHNFYKEITTIRGDQKNNMPFDQWYNNLAKIIRSEQRKLNIADQNFSQNFHATTFATQQNPIYISYSYTNNNRNNAYPNFATAKLSYVQVDAGTPKLHSSSLRMIRSETFMGHSEKRICAKVEQILSNENKYGNKYTASPLIILDINTPLSMCTSTQQGRNSGGNNHCFEDVNNSIQRISNTNPNIYVRVSYNFPYYEFDKQAGMANAEHMIQRQCRLPNIPLISKSLHGTCLANSIGNNNENVNNAIQNITPRITDLSKSKALTK